MSLFVQHLALINPYNREYYLFILSLQKCVYWKGERRFAKMLFSSITKQNIQWCHRPVSEEQTSLPEGRGGCPALWKLSCSLSTPSSTLFSKCEVNVGSHTCNYRHKWYFLLIIEWAVKGIVHFFWGTYSESYSPSLEEKGRSTSSRVIKPT